VVQVVHFYYLFSVFVEMMVVGEDFLVVVVVL
jgi:hypothetical protein